jgi:hypothetical protein
MGFLMKFLNMGVKKLFCYLHQLCQKIFESEQFPEEWSRGLIFPLFKGGPEDFKLDPNKYRGITLLSIIYTAVLNNRLSDYCESKGIFVDEQAGFRRDRSTIDQILILTEIIKHRRPKPTFCAFIDVAKAYDKVWRDGLWYKLWKAGIRGKMWRTLRNLYRKVESSVLLGKNRTDFFNIEVGLRQGCILSPLLFNIFVSDLRDYLQSLGRGVKWGNTRISMLYFADDIVLMAESKEDLELLLDAVFQYSLKWRLKFNYDKCNVVVFDFQRKKVISHGNCNQICTCGNHYRFGSNLIKEVVVYKYLGIELDNCLNLKVYKERILAKARSNMGRIWSMGIKAGHLSVKGAIHLWETLVRSHLEYAGVVWKEMKGDGEQLEQVQAEMAKRILRCSSYTTREAMYGDLGLWTLEGRRNYKKLVFWFNVVTLDDARILKWVYIVTKNTGKDSSWAKVIQSILEMYGLENLWSDEKLLFNLDNKKNLGAKTIVQHKNFWKRWIRGKIQEYEQKIWWMKLNNYEDISQSKTRTYITFKNKLKFERYLLTNFDARGRSYHTSLRSGTNRLEIEVGRWSGIDKSLRICKHCESKAVETEIHFVMECTRYKVLREKFYYCVAKVSGGKWDFAKRSTLEAFVLIMQGTGDEFELIIFKLFHIFLIKSFQLRDTVKIYSGVESVG